MSNTPILSLRNVSKSYGPVQALSGIDFDLMPGEVHALAGENGAGKSTLMNIIGGIVRPDGGEILLDGKPVAIASAAKAQALGIGMVHQEIVLCPDVSVAENILMSATAMNRSLFMDFRGLRRRAEQAMALLAPVPVDVPLGSLSISQQQLVEIAKALTLDCRILILDEPTAALTERETAILFEIVAGLRKRGIAIIYISHRMAEIFALCDRVTILRDGKHIGTERVAETTAERLVARMVGRELGQLYPAKLASAPGPEILGVRGLSGERFTDVNFTVRQREILGFAGLIGAGRSEIAKAICGLYPRTAGEIRLAGQPLAATSYADGSRAGVVYLSENRKTEGVFLDLPIAGNISALDLSRIATPIGTIDFAKEKRRAEDLGRKVKLKAARVESNVSNLSGGNQQKVALAKLLSVEPKLIFLDEPTRGVDVGAKSEIHRLLRELADAGVGIVVISSELPELIGLCDRVLVIHEGRIAGEVSGDRMTEEEIMKYASGLASDPSRAA